MPSAADEGLLNQVQRSLTEYAKTEMQQRRLSLPSSLSAITTKPLPPIIKLAHFHECSCKEFNGDKSHLSITTKRAELDESHGVALSYTWGEFDREPRPIGH